MAKNQSGPSVPQAQERPERSNDDQAVRKRSLLERAQAGEKLTEAQLAVATGNARVAPDRFAAISGVGSTVIQEFDSQRKRVFYLATAEHAAAAQLHGWNDHDISDPVRMNLETYRAALDAAKNPEPPDEKTGRSFYRPHEAALSQYRKAKG